MDTRVIIAAHHAFAGGGDSTPRDFAVVHGHTITPGPELHPCRIGIDTGAFASGQLTAIGLEGTDRWLITAEGAPA